MFSKHFYIQPEAGRDSFTGPKPQEIERAWEHIKSQYGENSQAHGFVLIDLGDAYFCEKSHAQALANYEQAMGILKAEGDSTPRAAFALDRVAHAKESLGDLEGAAADLSQALDIWKRNNLNTEELVGENHIARRTEALQDLERMIAFENARPPELSK